MAFLFYLFVYLFYLFHSFCGCNVSSLHVFLKGAGVSSHVSVGVRVSEHGWMIFEGMGGEVTAGLSCAMLVATVTTSLPQRCIITPKRMWWRGNAWADLFLLHLESFVPLLMERATPKAYNKCFSTKKNLILKMLCVILSCFGRSLHMMLVPVCFTVQHSLRANHHSSLTLNIYSRDTTYWYTPAHQQERTL